MPIPSEQSCPKCLARFIGSDIRDMHCPACQGLTDLNNLDYSGIEMRIMGSLGMDTTLYDLYGTLDNAVSKLKDALKAESEWAELSGHEKLEFQEWLEKRARSYKDVDKIDWIGAFYDWLEGS